VEGGTEIFIPLNKLRKSPKIARKTPHSESAIKAYAVRITAKGLLQNLVVEPELDADDTATGFYFVTIGEGRRLAQLLRVKRNEIKKTEPIRCTADTANDAFPADQFEAFKKLAEERGLGAEDIAVRFGVTPHVVRRRLAVGRGLAQADAGFPDAGNIAVDVFQAEREPIRIDTNRARCRPITGSSARTSSCCGRQTDGPSFFSTSCTSMARPSMPLLMPVYPSTR
jgi:ParB family transcriptional regulator, chromosome partitioning protein